MKYVYFASDFHLGIDAQTTSRERERILVRWLDHIAPTAREIFLVGDLFDYWFEYRQAVPRGHLRFLGRLAALRDQGIPITFFTGNHDMWMFDYFPQELGIPVLRHPVIREIDGRRFLIGHGDGLGPGDYGYKLIKYIFAHPLAQWLFARLHPNLGIRLMRFFSGKSRAATGDESRFLGPDKEWLVQYCESELRRGTQVDYFIFGHRHLPLDYTLSDGRTRYINLGDWLQYQTYAVFDGRQLVLQSFRDEDPGPRPT